MTNRDRELREECKESNIHRCCWTGQPHAVTLDKYQESVAELSDKSLETTISMMEYTINNEDDENKVKSAISASNELILEKQLRDNLLEGTKFSSVDEYVNSKCSDRMFTMKFGRGSTKPLPLRAIYLLLKKVKKYEDKSEENPDEKEYEKENPSNIYIPTKDVKVPKYYSVEDKNKYDMVNQPKHYMFNIDGHEVQAVDILKGTLTPEEFRGWLKGSYLTYLLRADRKNGLEDLKKANTFLNWQIQFDNNEELTLPGKEEKGE